jgi:hypothetical protein
MAPGQFLQNPYPRQPQRNASSASPRAGVSLEGMTMDIGSVLMGLLYVFLYCAVIILVAFAIRWAIVTFAGSLDPNIEKWGRIVVGLLCIIVIVGWLLSLLGVAHFPFLVQHR